MNENASHPAALLRIGELSRRTGVPTATLRSWEARHGFPASTRFDAGHRRYDEQQVELVTEVARLRRSGLPVPAAIRKATEVADRPSNSFFAALRSADHGLQSHLLGKRALSAVTAAMEDECLAQAQRPVLMGAFQLAHFYRQSESRWRELDRTAERTVVFADFARDYDVAGHPREVALPTDSPVLREWVLVCDAPGFSACVAGWELPSPPGTADRNRRFETVWTLDPGSVREATKFGIALLHRTDPKQADGLAASLSGSAGAPSPDLQRATALFARMVAYTQDAFGRERLAS
jgi:DICT domain-containing protein